MNWAVIEIQYSEVVRRINMGMEYLKRANEARAAGNESGYISWMNDLSELCNGQQMNLAIRALRDGLIGKEMFQKSILDGLYSETSGDRPKLTAMAARLIQLMISGMMLVVVVKSYKEGKEGGERFARIFPGELLEVQASVTTEIQRCVDNFEENLKEDLRKELLAGDKNEQIVQRLMKKIEVKYDFKEMVVLIYNDIAGFEKHKFGGPGVDILHFHGRCGIVFHSNKRGECNPKKQLAEEIVSKIVHGVWGDIKEARVGYDRVNKELQEHGITHTAIAVVKRCVDLWRSDSSTAACNVIWILGDKFTYFVFL